MLRHWREIILFLPVLQLHKFQVMAHSDWALDGLRILGFQFRFQTQDVLALSLLVCLPLFLLLVRTAVWWHTMQKNQASNWLLAL
uniref:Uncharacterized protein n=1 Tax=Arundo donax TaxID=35708 RepID=A0A0A9FQ58_ARUDO